MEVTFDSILNIVFYLGTLQGIVLSAFLYSAKRNIMSNRALGTLTLMWAIILTGFALSSQGLMRQYPHLLRTFSHIEFAFFPLLYLSVKYLVSNPDKFYKKDLLHFIPLLFNVILYSGFYFKTGDEKIAMINSNGGYYFVANIISDEILALQGIIYPILALIILGNYNRRVKDYQSNIDKTVLKGMKIGTILALIAWIIGAVAANLHIMRIDIGIDLFLFVYLSIVIIIYVISYVALKSPEIFKLSEKHITPFYTQQLDIIEDEGAKTRPPAESISTSSQVISSEDAQFKKWNNQLVEFIKENKSYLDPELSLQDLANELKISRHQLSAVINKKQQMNFYEFVNTYRVNEVKRLMQDPKKRHLKIVSLAYEAGFNSKASFNRIFKQLTNQTPSEYLNAPAIL